MWINFNFVKKKQLFSFVQWSKFLFGSDLFLTYFSLFLISLSLESFLSDLCWFPHHPPSLLHGHFLKTKFLWQSGIGADWKRRIVVWCVSKKFFVLGFKRKRSAALSLRPSFLLLLFSLAFYFGNLFYKLNGEKFFGEKKFEFFSIQLKFGSRPYKKWEKLLRIRVDSPHIQTLYYSI